MTQPDQASSPLCALCLRYLLRLRLGALAGQTLAYGWGAAVLDLPLPLWPLIALGLALLIYTVWLIRWHRATPALRPCSLLRETVVDLAALSLALYSTGGSHNPLAILLLLPVTVAAATLETRLIRTVTATAVAAYTLLMAFHLNFPVPHHGISGFDLHVEGMWYGFILTAVLIAYFVARMGAALRDRDRQLAEAREKVLIESSPTGVLLVGDGRVVLANPRLAELAGCPRDALIGSDALNLIHPEDRERVGRAVFGEPIGPGPSPEIECRLHAQSEPIRWVVVRRALIATRGAPLTMIAMQDLTERKRMEQELRDLSARLLEVQEEERRRVARDLHDGPCQTLTATRLILEGCLASEPPTERRASMRTLHTLVAFIRDAADEVRRIATELRPAMLDDLGLLATVRWYLGSLATLYPTLAIRHRIELAEADIPQPIKTPIFRILQEASSNAAKHSRGSALDVRLSAGDGWLWLRVADDGRGFDPKFRPADGIGPGLGLSSMRERAELSGGELRLLTSPGEGTTVEARWPIDSARA